MADETVLERQSFVEEIKRKSFIGAIQLTSRTFILQIVSLIGTFILTVILSPKDFGIFGAVSSFINILNYFSDIGLGAALIQKKQEPTRADLVSTFSIQQLLVGTVVCITLLFSGSIAKFLGLDTQGLWLIRAFAIAFAFSSLKSIPSILLERKLSFQKLVASQIIETISFYTIAIVLSMRGYGIMSYAWAVLVRGILGTVVLYITSPWKIGFGFDLKSLKSLLSFGLPYQANSFIALIKDDLLYIIIGRFLGYEILGYFLWAKKWSDSTLRLFMDSIIRVTFPAFSRLQHDVNLLSRAVSKSLVFVSLTSFPVAIGMMFMIRQFIYVVPNYLKWEPALVTFYFLTAGSVAASLSGPLYNALLALGQVKKTLTLMIMWTVLTYIFVPLSIYLFGRNGLGIAMAIIGLTSFAPAYFLKKIVAFSLIHQIAKPALATIGMIVGLLITFSLLGSPFYRLVLGIPIGGAIYASLIYVLMGQEIFAYLSLLRKKPA